MGAGGIDAGGGDVGASQSSGGSGGSVPFEELYNQTFGRLYDFALRLLRDREEAALAVQASYLAVYQELQAGETYVSFPVQLFSAAHLDIADRLRRRRGPIPELQDALDLPDAVWAANPAVANDAAELTRTVWEVAAVARPDELEILDLSLRQGLDAEGMAAVLRTRPETVQGRLTRLSDAMEDSFSGLLLMRRGRQACVDLDMLIGEATWSMSVRRRVLRHLQTCQICQRTRAGFPPGTNVYSALAVVEVPRGWQEAMLARLSELAGGSLAGVAVVMAAPQDVRPAPPPPVTLEPAAAGYGSGGSGGVGGWTSDLFASGNARGPLLGMLLGALLILVVVLGGLCAAGAFDGGGGGDDEPDATETPAETRTPTRTRTPTASPTPEASETAPPASTATPAPPTPPPPPTATQPPPPPAPTATRTQPPPRPTNTSPPVVTPPP